MPGRVRKPLLSLALVLLVALATGGVAAAANGGFTPVQPESPNAAHTATAYYVVLGFTLAIFVLVELPKIATAPAAADPIHVTVEGHQYYWQFDYPNGARSIGTLHVPVGEVVDLKVVSPDVIHSWWIPALGGKIQAIPGRTNHFWFRAERPGSYQGQCA